MMILFVMQFKPLLLTFFLEQFFYFKGRSADQIISEKVLIKASNLNLVFKVL